jgi:hypothetical protein
VSQRKGSSAAAAAEESAKSNGSQPRADSVSQIRDIIFGEQMTDYEGRFSALEKKLVAEIEAQRTALDDAISSLQAMVEKRVDEVEKATVQRDRLATDLEKLVQKLRDS